jgi:DNA-binding GntR family transcriptional regulator
VGEQTILELRHKTLHERVYEALLGLIGAGALAPGDQLDEQALAARLGVSRTPLRAAIARLAQEGLVVTLPYRGSFVRRFTVEEIDGLYEVRAALEGLAARRAARRLTPAGLQTIGAILDECQAALDAGDLEAYGQADARFHRALAEASGNPTLVETLDGLRLRIHRFRDLANREPGLRRRAAREREQIVDALARRDAEAAGRLLEQHIDHVRRTVLRQLTERSK